MGREVSVGVDLIEFKKAERFYRTHQKDLSRFLDPAEISFVRRHPVPHRLLAEILAAKEAVFKSLCLPWMGRSGFKDIHILTGKNGHLSFRLAGRLKKVSSGKKGTLESFRNERFTLVKCIPTCAGT